MAISNTVVKDNLVALSGVLAASGDVSDDLKGMSALAGNEAEAAIADVAQTLSFTTWISDICDGLQQEKELDRGSDEYNENAENIRTTINEINNLGKSLGFDHDIIPTPNNGQEAIVAAQYVYNNVALPYQAQKGTGEKIDYAKYITCQSQHNPIAEAMSRLNSQVAQSKQYGTHAVNFRKAQVKAANNFTALNYMFLDGIDSINEYSHELNEMKGFLKKEDDNASQGISTTNMGTFGIADKIDFEGDDVKLRNKMRDAIRKAEKYLKQERRMLSAGHIGTERQAVFADLMKDCMKEIQHCKKEIEKDNLLDTQATAELEKTMVERPDMVSKEHEEKYIEMVKKQQFGKPTFTGEDLISSAALIRLGIEGMNVALMAANVAPIGIAASSIDMLQLGKFAFHSASFLTRESAKEARDFSLMPTYNGGKVAAAKVARSVALTRSKSFSQNVYRQGSIIAMNMRQVMAGLVQPIDETAPDYYANKHCVENMETLFNQILKEDETQTELSKDSSDKQRGLLVKLQAAAIMATGNKIFNKDPATMSNAEIAIAIASVKTVMSPMKSKDKSMLENFADSFGVRAEEMTAMQAANMDAMIAFGASGNNAAALTIREKQTEIADLSYQYKAHKARRTATDDLDAEDIEERIKAKQGEMNNVLRTYGPQCQQMQMLGMSYMCQSGQVTYMTDFSPNDALNGTAVAMQQSQPSYDMQYVPKSMAKYM